MRDDCPSSRNCGKVLALDMARTEKLTSELLQTRRGLAQYTVTESVVKGETTNDAFLHRINGRPGVTRVSAVPQCMCVIQIMQRDGTYKQGVRGASKRGAGEDKTRQDKDLLALI